MELQSLTWLSDYTTTQANGYYWSVSLQDAEPGLREVRHAPVCNQGPTLWLEEVSVLLPLVRGQHPVPWKMFSWSWSSLKQHLCVCIHNCGKLCRIMWNKEEFSWDMMGRAGPLGRRPCTSLLSGTAHEGRTRWPWGHFPPWILMKSLFLALQWQMAISQW